MGCEWDGATKASQAAFSVKNLLTELRQVFKPVIQLYSDNEALVDFMNSEGKSKGMRHTELQMWSLREQVKKGDIILTHMSGAEIPVDLMTKPGTKRNHRIFMRKILGLDLLDSKEVQDLLNLLPEDEFSPDLELNDDQS
jgi:hypothetical protein